MTAQTASGLNDYVKSLPLGIVSYPECRVTAVLFNAIVADHPNILTRCAHPTLGASGATPRDDASWLPLTVHVAAVLALIDVHGGKVDKARQQLRAYGMRILAMARYKVMFFVLSPTFLVMGASSRYARDFVGVKAASQHISRTSARLTLTAPAKLYPAAYVDAYNGIFEAVIACGGGNDVSSIIERVTDTQSHSLFTWT